MKHFIESNRLLENAPAARKRLHDDGYLFLRDILPKDQTLHLRKRILECCQEAGWLRESFNLIDAFSDKEPILEGSPEWCTVYAKIQALEEFHRLNQSNFAR